MDVDNKESDTTSTSTITLLMSIALFEEVDKRYCWNVNLKHSIESLHVSSSFKVVYMQVLAIYYYYYYSCF